MPNSNDPIQIHLGRWRYVGDRTLEREWFLEAIRVKAPNVLKDLFETVLPLHQRAHPCRLRPKVSDGNNEDSVEDGIQGEDGTEDEGNFEFWTVHDIDTWNCAWDWAERAISPEVWPLTC